MMYIDNGRQACTSVLWLQYSLLAIVHAYLAIAIAIQNQMNFQNVSLESPILNKCLIAKY